MSKKVASLWFVVALSVPFGVFATVPSCSIHPPKGASIEELKKLAKVSEPEARQAALAAIKADKDAVVKSAELEAEEGCLVWSFDIKLPHKKGVQEVMIDAGNGQVLSKVSETESKEKAEQKAESKAQTSKP